MYVTYNSSTVILVKLKKKKIDTIAEPFLALVLQVFSDSDKNYLC